MGSLLLKGECHRKNMERRLPCVFAQHSNPSLPFSMSDSCDGSRSQASRENFWSCTFSSLQCEEFCILEDLSSAGRSLWENTLLLSFVFFLKDSLLATTRLPWTNLPSEMCWMSTHSAEQLDKWAPKIHSSRNVQLWQLLRPVDFNSQEIPHPASWSLQIWKLPGLDTHPPLPSNPPHLPRSAPP